MINERYKSMIRSISTMNKLIDNLTESNPHKATLGDPSVVDKPEAQRQMGEKGKAMFQKIKTNLSQFKELEAEVPQSKNSSVTANFNREIGTGILKINFTQINPPKLEDGDVGDVEPTLNITHQFKVKSYGGKHGDVIKIVGEAGTLDKKVFLLNFEKIVKNNNPNIGKISHCNNNNCDKKGPHSQWQGKVQW